MELRATILRNGNGKNIRYFDKNGEELFEGDYILGFKAGILGYSISEMKAHKK
ncbi:MAG: hypothetical protein ACLUPZ_07050 [Lachnospiraceae bacterium]